MVSLLLRGFWFNALSSVKCSTMNMNMNRKHTEEGSV